MTEKVSAARLVDAARFFDRLASLPRTGWLLRGVTDPESIAEHAFGVAVVAAEIVDELRGAGETVDGEKVLRMALLHDAAEVFTGDVPMPAKSPELKAALGQAEASLLASVLTAGQLALWHESEMGQSLEARIVKAADKLQLLVKASIYEEQKRGSLAEFFAHPRNRVAGIAIVEASYAEIDRRRA